MRSGEWSKLRVSILPRDTNTLAIVGLELTTLMPGHWWSSDHESLAFSPDHTSCCTSILLIIKMMNSGKGKVTNLSTVGRFGPNFGPYPFPQCIILRLTISDCPPKTAHKVGINVLIKISFNLLITKDRKIFLLQIVVFESLTANEYRRKPLAFFWFQ